MFFLHSESFIQSGEKKKSVFLDSSCVTHKYGTSQLIFIYKDLYIQHIWLNRFKARTKESKTKAKQIITHLNLTSETEMINQHFL